MLPRDPHSITAVCTPTDPTAFQPAPSNTVTFTSRNAQWPLRTAGQV